MAKSLSILGNLMVTLGLAWLGFTLLQQLVPRQLAAEPAPQLTQAETTGPPQPTVAVAEAPGVLIDPELDLVDGIDRPITRLRAPRLLLDTMVARAPYVPDANGGTWAVPDDRVGHAENTVGAGERGNAVLFGHVSWNGRPGAFKDLHRLRPADDIEVQSDSQWFRYRVVSVGSTDPGDSAALQAAASPVLTLVTCDGLWLPHIWDYTGRLVVRAEIAPLGG